MFDYTIDFNKRQENEHPARRVSVFLSIKYSKKSAVLAGFKWRKYNLNKVAELVKQTNIPIKIYKNNIQMDFYQKCP